MNPNDLETTDEEYVTSPPSVQQHPRKKMVVDAASLRRPKEHRSNRVTPIQAIPVDEELSNESKEQLMKDLKSFDTDKKVNDHSSWLISRGDFHEALFFTERALELNKTDPDRIIKFLRARREICIFEDTDEEYKANTERFLEALTTIMRNKKQIQDHPFEMIFYPIPPIDAKKVHGNLINKAVTAVQEQFKIKDMTPEQKKKPKVAFLSSGLFNHTTAHLIQGVLRNIDRNRIDVICLQTQKKDPVQDPFRRLLACWCIDFVDFDVKPGREAAKQIYKMKINILIDLIGPTYTCHYETFAYGPCSLICEWLGYPNGTGNPDIDYLLVDRVLAPDVASREHFVETVVTLPNSYFIGDHKYMFPHLTYNDRVKTQENETIVLSGTHPIKSVLKTPSAVAAIRKMLEEGSREIRVNGHVVYNGIRMKDVGWLETEKGSVTTGSIQLEPHTVVATWRKHYELNESDLVIANFNFMKKIDRPYILACIAVMKQVRNSKLWLVKKPEAAVRSITDFFVKNGLKASRLHFSDYEITKEEHMRRGVCVDLFFDPFIVNGHTTMMDGYWSGTPTITMTGLCFPARVGTSINTFMKLPVLITTTPDEFVDRAVELLSNPLLLTSLRQLVEYRKIHTPMFDSKQFADGLTDTLLEIWQMYVESALLAYISHPVQDWEALFDDVTIEYLRNLASIPDEQVQRRGIIRRRSSESSDPDQPASLVVHNSKLQLIAADQISRQQLRPINLITFHPPSSSFQIMFDCPVAQQGIEGIQTKYMDGQRILNLIVVENAFEGVKWAMQTVENFRKTYYGPLMANVLVQRFKESFNGNPLPRMPEDINLLTDFFAFGVPGYGIKCRTQDQVEWIREFFVSINVDTTRLLEFYQKNPPNNSFGASNCPKCGLDMDTLSDENKEIHRSGHREIVHPTNQIYGFDEEPHPPFVLDVDGSLDVALDVCVGTKFYDGQQHATKNLWLLPSIQKLMNHLRRTPGIFSGTEYIGYEIVQLLNCHLKSRPFPTMNNRNAMNPDEKREDGQSFFKFDNRDFAKMMINSFKSAKEFEEDVISKDNDANKYCVLCDCEVEDGHLEKFHLLQQSKYICETCGFEVHPDYKEGVKVEHKLLHDVIIEWTESTHKQDGQLLVKELALRNCNF